MALHPAETNFYKKQMEIHLMEAHIALVRASSYAARESETNKHICQAVGHVASALEAKE
jgi:hypothetical protein